MYDRIVKWKAENDPAHRITQIYFLIIKRNSTIFYIAGTFLLFWALRQPVEAILLNRNKKYIVSHAADTEWLDLKRLP